jgi:hypothetical protein
LKAVASALASAVWPLFHLKAAQRTVCDATRVYAVEAEFRGRLAESTLKYGILAPIPPRCVLVNLRVEAGI